MASLRQIRRRIKTAKNIQQITKAMKMVAAARLRKSQARVLAARPYAQTIASVLRDLTRGQEEALSHPLLDVRESLGAGQGPLNLVLIGADKGLCGGFNANIIRQGLALYQQAGDRPVKLTLVGRKIRDFFVRLGVPTAGEYVNFFNRLSFADADVIASDLVKSYVSGEFDEVVLLYTEFRSVVTLKVTAKRLLPFASQPQPEDIAAAGPRTEFSFEPNGRAILEALVPRAVKSQVWRALLESQVSEFAAKMTAMDNASRNSEEMIGTLTLFANRIRQAAITREIAEIVGGAEALK
jgi:F-type H+-transporting ATPase subunit gamma